MDNFDPKHKSTSSYRKIKICCKSYLFDEYWWEKHISDVKNTKQLLNWSKRKQINIFMIIFFLSHIRIWNYFDVVYVLSWSHFHLLISICFFPFACYCYFFRVHLMISFPSLTMCLITILVICCQKKISSFIQRNTKTVEFMNELKAIANIKCSVLRSSHVTFTVRLKLRP